MDISAGASASLEEFHKPFFIVMNLAVGGVNFVQITNPSEITAPMPAPLYVDWIRLYDNGYTELYRGDDLAETNNFGIFTDTTPVDNAVQYGVDSDLFVWNNMTITAPTPYEGGSAWQFNVGAGNWFGGGVFCRSNRNMQGYSDGALHLHMKTTSNQTIGVGIASSAAGEGWVDLAAGGEQFGLLRDGQWHEVVIPCSRFGNIDFRTIKQALMLRGGAPTSAFNFSVDNVYWSSSPPRPAPAGYSFGIFTENPAHKTAGEALLGVDQEFYIWASTMLALPTSPYEGAGSIALGSAPGLNWFGAAFTPKMKYNLSPFRYPQSRLHFALKTTSTQTFQIGMKSGTVDNIGQRWITFANGADPYGFVRNGQWQVVDIPMSDFGGVDLLEVGQFFELLGTAGPITNIEIDDVCFTNGGTPLIPGGPGDLTQNGYVDLVDWARFAYCFAGPDVAPGENVSTSDFSRADADDDDDVDLRDVGGLQAAFTGGN